MREVVRLILQNNLLMSCNLDCDNTINRIITGEKDLPVTSELILALVQLSEEN